MHINKVGSEGLGVITRVSVMVIRNAIRAANLIRRSTPWRTKAMSVGRSMTMNEHERPRLRMRRWRKASNTDSKAPGHQHVCM